MVQCRHAHRPPKEQHDGEASDGSTCLLSLCFPPPPNPLLVLPATAISPPCPRPGARQEALQKENQGA